MTRVSRVAAAAVTTLSLFSLAACGTSKVSGDDVAKQVSSQLAAKVGQKPDKVTCPDLDAKVGSTVTCKLTAGGDTYDTKVKVTKVDGSNVNFSISVADKPN